MFFLSDLSTFGRTLGTKDKKPRIKRLLKATFNPDVANGSAVGGTLGYLASSIHNGNASIKGNKYGTLGGLALGTGLSIANKYRKQNKQH